MELARPHEVRRAQACMARVLVCACAPLRAPRAEQTTGAGCGRRATRGTARGAHTWAPRPRAAPPLSSGLGWRPAPPPPSRRVSSSARQRQDAASPRTTPRTSRAHARGRGSWRDLFLLLLAAQGLDAVVLRVQHPLHLCELARLLRLAMFFLLSSRSARDSQRLFWTTNATEQSFRAGG